MTKNEKKALESLMKSWNEKSLIRAKETNRNKTSLAPAHLINECRRELKFMLESLSITEAEKK